jgi:hypothetical protein
MIGLAPKRRPNIFFYSCAPLASSASVAACGKSSSSRASAFVFLLQPVNEQDAGQMLRLALRREQVLGRLEILPAAGKIIVCPRTDFWAT